MTEEMMDDALGDAVSALFLFLLFAGHHLPLLLLRSCVQFDVDSEEEDAVVDQVMQEIGLDLNALVRIERC